MMAFAHIELIPVQTGMSPLTAHAAADALFRRAGLASILCHGTEVDLCGEVATVMREADRVRSIVESGTQHEFAALVRLEPARKLERFRRLA